MKVPKTFPFGKIRLKWRHEHITMMLSTALNFENIPGGGGGGGGGGARGGGVGGQQPDIMVAP